MAEDKPIAFLTAVAVCTLLLVGCEREPTAEVAAEPVVEPGWLMGAYSGSFPCVDCPGIDTGLWLRDDGAFFYRQHYLADEAQDQGSAFYAMGRWRWDEIAGSVALERDGPTRWFDPVAEQTLRFRTNAQPAHLLSREDIEPPFDYLVALEGEYHTGKTQRFVECRTGLDLAIVEKGEGRRIRRQYRSMPRGQPIVAIVTGRMLTQADGSLALSITRLVALKPGERCVTP